MNNNTITNYIDFLYVMTLREINARYKHAFLGFLWVLLNPLMQMFILGFVFQFFIPAIVDNYFFFLFSGLLPWNFFSLSLLKTTPSIVYERALIQKSKFPRESIVLSIVLSNFFHFLMSLLLFVIILSIGIVFFAQFSEFTKYMLVRLVFLIPLSLLLTIFTSGLSMGAAAINVRFRDIHFILQAVVPLWFYLTPVVFTLDLLPEKIVPLFYLNPMTPIIEAYHWIFFDITPIMPSLWLPSLLFGLCIAGAGALLFRKEQQYFDDWI